MTERLESDEGVRATSAHVGSQADPTVGRVISWYELVMLFVGVLSAVAVIGLAADLFYIEPIVAIAVLLTIVALAALGLRPRTTGLRLSWGALALAATTLVFRFERYPNLQGGQDQGLYVNMAHILSKWHQLDYPDEFHAELPADLQWAYQWTAMASAPLIDQSDSLYAISFYPLHPAWMAMWQRFAGGYGAQLSLIMFALLGVAGGWLLALELDGRRRVAWLFAALLACNPALAFFTKFPVTEIVALAFVINGFLFLVRYVRADEPSLARLYGLISVLSFTGLFYTRWQFMLYLPFFGLVFLACLVPIWSVRARRRLGWLIAGLSGLFIVSVKFYQSKQNALFVPMVEEIRRISPPPLLIAVAVMVGLVGVVGLRRFVAADVFERQSIFERSARASSLLLCWLPIGLFVASIPSILDLYETGVMEPYGITVPVGTDPLIARFHVVYRLMLFASPFGFVLVAALPFTLQNRSVQVQLLILFFSLSWAGMLLRPYVPYLYYYGRYLVVDVLPAMLLLAAIVIVDQSRREFGRFVAGGAAAVMLVYSLTFSALQWGGVEGEDPGQFDDFASVIAPKDIVVLPAMNNQIVVPLRMIYERAMYILPPRREGVLHHAQVLEGLQSLAAARGGRLLYLTQAGGLPGRDPVAVVDFTDNYMTNTDHHRGGQFFPASERRLLLPMKWEKNVSMWEIHVLPKEEVFLMPCSGLVDFTSELTSPFSMTNFWSVETHGRWTNGTKSSFVCDLGDPSSRPETVSLSLLGYVPVDNMSQELKISIEGQPAAEVFFDIYSPRTEVELEIPDSEDNVLEIEFEIPYATSPAALGLSLDARTIGVSVGEISFADS